MSLRKLVRPAVSNSMRAAVLHHPFDLRLEEVSQPLCGPGEVKIQITYNGLCGTDATEYTKGPMMVPLNAPHPGSGHVGPTVLGHEFIGVVVEEGAGVTGRLGKRVACGAGVSCGSCKMCVAGRTNLCEFYYTLGLSTDGGLAEYVVAPSSICFDVPVSCSDEDAGLAQPLAVAIHSVRRAEIASGSTVAMLGVGAIGAFILAALSDFDCEIIAIDIDQSRLDLAQKLGASKTFLLDPLEKPADIMKHFPFGFDVVFETSGVNGAAERALALTAQGGKMVLIGLNKSKQELILSDVVLREINIITSVAHVCGEDIPEALSMLSKKSLSHILLDRIVPLSMIIEEGMEPLSQGTINGKILVDPRR